MQVLNPKAIQGYASVLDYEALILVRSMYFETRMGITPINPANFVVRYVLKYAATVSSFLGHKSLTNMVRPLQQHVNDILRDSYRFHTRSLDQAYASFVEGGHGTHR
jgi:hypothetical protein